ncbi:MAG: c-type cytochrome [Alphaproteobacteria bacterium]
MTCQFRLSRNFRDRMTRTACRGAALLVALLFPLATASAAETADTVGESEYRAYCGGCHGADGRGEGPVANYLSVKPKDLTALSIGNDGNFPFMRIYRTIDGRDEIGVHGTREMPVWGDRFKEEAAGPHRETQVRGRILSLILYLENIQRDK